MVLDESTTTHKKKRLHHFNINHIRKEHTVATKEKEYIASAAGDAVFLWNPRQEGWIQQPLCKLHHDGVKSVEFCLLQANVLATGGGRWNQDMERSIGSAESLYSNRDSRRMSGVVSLPTRNHGWVRRDHGHLDRDQRGDATGGMEL